MATKVHTKREENGEVGKKIIIMMDIHMMMTAVMDETRNNGIRIQHNHKYI